MNGEMGAYHHGNLKVALIEACIKILNTQGEAALSLRSVAAACGVSHAAPYNHFSDKEALLQAADEHVLCLLQEQMHTAKARCRYAHDTLFELACAYVRFFARAPQYYRFVFLRSGAQAWSIREENGVITGSFPPFCVFSETAEHMMTLAKIPPSLRGELLLELWSALQGVTALFALDGFCAPQEGREEEILCLLLRGRMHIK